MNDENSKRTRRAFLQGALAAGAGSVATACHRPILLDRRGWPDARGVAYILPCWQWAPQSARELVQAVVRAEQEGHRIRMTGSGHSFSDVAMNDDWLLAPTGLTFFPPLEPSCLRSSARPDRLFRVAAGTPIRELNAELDRHGLALENMGGADFQTIVGAAATGTHGLGLAFGPIASQIASIQVVGPGGELLQVEPSDGITDPAKFSNALPEDHEQRVTLRQDDELFRSLAVGLGSLGVFYAVVLRVVPRYWIIERRTVTTWEELSGPGGALARLLGGQPLCGGAAYPPTLPARPCFSGGRPPDHFEVLYTPYPDAGGAHLALLTERWRTENVPPDAGGVRGSALFTVGEDLTLLADKHGLLAPLFGTLTAGEILAFHEEGLRGLAQSHYANVSYRVFNTGVVNDVNAYGIELALPVDQMTAAVEKTFETAAALAPHQIFHTAPISLRFVAPFPAHVAMQNRSVPTVTVEIGVLTGLLGAEDLLRTHEAVMVAELSARPHWGLDRNLFRGTAQVERLYPDWHKWLGSFEQMNPRGTFDGLLTDRLRISRS